MYKYIFSRILMLIPVLLGVSFFAFTMLYFTPGDPARIILGDAASPEMVRQFREKEGLDKPFFIQYLRYLYKAVVHGDIGSSYITKRPVAGEILQVLPNTIQLAGISVLCAVIIGIPFGVISAIKQYSLTDTVVTIFAMVGLSVPVFWLGLLLILYFSIYLKWLPSSGLNSWRSVILPAIALGTSSLAVIVRMTRSSMLEVIRSDYIRTVRAKGQREFIVIYRHALGNALIPIITVTGLQFGILLGGSVLTESVFSIAGVGRLMVDAIKSRDFPIVQGGVLIIALAFSIVNLLVDLLYAYVDPRVKALYKN
jgi:peptide/nickel transport system permease protein